MLALAACSRPAGEQAGSRVEKASPVQAVNAELTRLQAQGKVATAREITSIEYPAYRSLMRASGLDQALGGEARADAALRELFGVYERKVQGFESDLPKMVSAAYSGIDIGYSGFAASMITGMLQNDAAISSWQRAQEEGRSSGSHSQNGQGSVLDMQWSATQSTVTTTFEGELPGGLKGKLTTMVKVDTCPDPAGKVGVEFQSRSELRSTTSAGTGGFVKVTAKLAKYLDDDAHLIDDQIDSDVHVEQTTFDNYDSTFIDLTQSFFTSRNEGGTQVNGRSKAATDANVQSAEALAKMGMMAAMQALEGAKKAWESGRCVDIKVTNNPEKRSGLRPNTAFDIEAMPRAKSDGAPTGGTVSATLSGGESLQPASGKAKADAKYQYTGPKEEDQSASIAFEARSKRGIGKATLAFDTRNKQAYRATGGIGDDQGVGEVCDLEEPFTITGKTGVIRKFSPSSDAAGSFVTSGTFGGVGVRGTGKYTVVVSADGQATALKTRGSVKTVTPYGTFNRPGPTTYSLTPIASCK
jgi:hypothetical protein